MHQARERGQARRGEHVRLSGTRVAVAKCLGHYCAPGVAVKEAHAARAAEAMRPHASRIDTRLRQDSPREADEFGGWELGGQVGVRRDVLELPPSVDGEEVHREPGRV